MGDDVRLDRQNDEVEGAERLGHQKVEVERLGRQSDDDDGDRTARKVEVHEDSDANAYGNVDVVGPF